MMLLLISLPLLATVVSESGEGVEQSRKDSSDRDAQDDRGKSGWQDAVPGIPGKDYPNLDYIPETSFSCADKMPGGYYADVETGCQVFHVCSTVGLKSSFLCPAGSIFNQKYFVCDWWYDFECENAHEFYSLNDQSTGQSTGQPIGQLTGHSPGNQPYLSTNDNRVNSLNDGADLSLAGTTVSRNSENGGITVKSFLEDSSLDGRSQRTAEGNDKTYRRRITVNYWRPRNKERLTDNAPRGFSFERPQFSEANDFNKDERLDSRDDEEYYESEGNETGNSGTLSPIPRNGNFGERFASGPTDFRQPEARKTEDRQGGALKFRVPFRSVANVSQEENYDNSRLVDASSLAADENDVARTTETIVTSKAAPSSRQRFNELPINEIPRPTGGLDGGLGGGHGYTGFNKRLPGSNAIAGTTSEPFGSSKVVSTTASYDENGRKGRTYSAEGLNSTGKQYIPPDTEKQGQVVPQNPSNSPANDPYTEESSFQQFSNENNERSFQVSLTDPFLIRQYLPPVQYAAVASKNNEQTKVINAKSQERYLPAL